MCMGKPSIQPVQLLVRLLSTTNYSPLRNPPKPVHAITSIDVGVARVNEPKV